VGHGFVASLSRPGRNITGLAWDATPEIAGKCIDLLTEVRPAPSRVVGIVDPGFPDLALRKGADSAAKIRGLTLEYVPVGCLMVWVSGIVQPRDRAYFVAPVPDASAKYRDVLPVSWSWNECLCRRWLV